jgi:hypothetical protein
MSDEGARMMAREWGNALGDLISLIPTRLVEVMQSDVEAPRCGCSKESLSGWVMRIDGTCAPNDTHLSHVECAGCGATWGWGAQ